MIYPWADFNQSYFKVFVQAKTCTEEGCHYMYLHVSLRRDQAKAFQLSSYPQSQSWNLVAFQISTEKHLVCDFMLSKQQLKSFVLAIQFGAKFSRSLSNEMENLKS